MGGHRAPALLTIRYLELPAAFSIPRDEPHMHGVSVRLPRVGFGLGHSAVGEVGANPTLSRNGNACKAQSGRLSEEWQLLTLAVGVCRAHYVRLRETCGMTAGRTA